MSKIVLISNDSQVVAQVKSYADMQGLEFELKDDSVVLPSQNSATIIPFPSVEKQETKSIAQLEADAIVVAVKNSNGNFTEAAKSLGIGRATLYRKVKEYNLETKTARKSA